MFSLNGNQEKAKMRYNFIPTKLEEIKKVREDHVLMVTWNKQNYTEQGE